MVREGREGWREGEVDRDAMRGMVVVVVRVLSQSRRRRRGGGRLWGGILGDVDFFLSGVLRRR